MTQQSLELIAVSDPHVAPEDKPRMQSQNDRILEMLMDRPCTTRELMDGSGSLRVGARIKDLRNIGNVIESENLGGGSWRYRLVRE